MASDNNRRIYLLLFSLLILSVTSLFFSSWDCFISNPGNKYIPVVLLITSLILIMILVYFFLLSDRKNINKNIPGIKELEDSGENKKQEKRDTHYVSAKDIAARIIEGSGKHNQNETKSNRILRNIALEFNAMQAILFLRNPVTSVFELHDSYALTPDNQPQPFSEGDGLHGQAVLEKKVIKLSNIPVSFRTVSSGLGSTNPQFLYLLPVVNKNKVIALIEFSTFEDIGNTGMAVLNILLNKLGEELQKSEKRK